MIYESVLAACSACFGERAPQYELALRDQASNSPRDNDSGEAPAPTNAGTVHRCVLTFACAENGRADIAASARRLGQAVRAGQLEPSAISEALIDRTLDGGACLPDPDFAIVLGSVFSTVGFRPWQLSATEICFGGPVALYDADGFLHCLSAFGATVQRHGR